MDDMDVLRLGICKRSSSRRCSGRSRLGARDPLRLGPRELARDPARELLRLATREPGLLS